MKRALCRMVFCTKAVWVVLLEHFVPTLNLSALLLGFVGNTLAHARAKNRSVSRAILHFATVLLVVCESAPQNRPVRAHE